MTLGISMFKKIFPLQTIMQIYHLKYISPMCYAQHHDVISPLLKKLLMLIDSIILAISRCNTLRYPGIQFRPFGNNVCDTTQHKWCSTKSQCDFDSPNIVIRQILLLKCWVWHMTSLLKVPISTNTTSQLCYLVSLTYWDYTMLTSQCNFLFCLPKMIK